MKTLLIATTTCLLLALTVKGQERKGEEFLLLSNTINFNRANQFNYYNNESNILSLLYTKAINKESAWRIGVGIRDYSSYPRILSTQRNDTTFITEQYRSSTMPHLIAGKEWRKYLHKDVMIIGGVDIGLGAGSSDESTVESYIYQDVQSTRIYNDRDQGFSLYNNISPFTGVRVSWKRLSLGYQFSAMAQSTYISAGNSNTFDFDLSLKQSLSIGYRFNSNKPIKRR